MQAIEVAKKNFEQHLIQNVYPGRGLVIGRTSKENVWVIIYWIMGRSAHSQNRKFVVEDSSLKTEPVDPSLVEDPSLIIYEAMLELPNIYLVSNGAQTRGLYETLKSGGSFDSALDEWEREPDAPNYTPRISGMLNLTEKEGKITLSILKANIVNPELTDRCTFRPATASAGFGFCITTYMGDGKPLPSFSGDPLLLPCEGNADDILDSYWNALNSKNRISIAVKEISADNGTSEILIRNRF